MAETSEIQLNLTTTNYEEKPKKRKIDRDDLNDEAEEAFSVKTPDRKKSKKNQQKGKF